jgi:hypothetical protein
MDAAAPLWPPPLIAEQSADPRAQERDLRNALADGDNPVEAGLHLAALLSQEERYDEALAAIDATSARGGDELLRLTRASLLRDLGRRHEAAAELRGLAAERGPSAMHPGTRFQWAELEWMSGNAAAATAVLSELMRTEAADPWCIEHRPQIDAMSLALARGEQAVLQGRDLLAELRRHGSLARRGQILDQLPANLPADPELAAGLLERAVVIACGDDSPIIRARGVRMARPATDDRVEFYTTALADEDPLVRRVAATSVAECMGRDAVPLLLDRLEVEEDTGTFAALHEVLATIVPGGPESPASGCVSAEARHALTEAWRAHCSL